jgi:hypothetical protein
VGALDPQAQNALLEDLKRTDPALWPQLVQTFRASIAYRRQVAERAQREAQQLAQGDPRFTNQQAGQVRPAGYVQDGQQAKPLPEAVDGAVTPSAPNGEFAAGYPDTKMPPGKLTPSASDPNDWRSQLTSAIRSLQAEASAANGQSSTSLSASNQSKLRLLQLAAGQRDDALKPLTGVSGAEQEFWGEQLFGLATLLDDQRMPDSQRRAADGPQSATRPRRGSLRLTGRAVRDPNPNARSGETNVRVSDI